MFARKKARVDWKSVQDAFTKPRRLHLEKGSDGVHHCPVIGCERTGFSSQRGCRKHFKTKHGIIISTKNQTYAILQLQSVA